MLNHLLWYTMEILPIWYYLININSIDIDGNGVSERINELMECSIIIR